VDLYFSTQKRRKMAVAGYSGTPLLQKLGIKPGMKLLLLNEPGDYEALLQSPVQHQRVKKNETPDLIHLFVETNTLFEKEMKKLIPIIERNSDVIIWVSWYKKSAKKDTDITEDAIRDYALKNDLVDIKVCAVSDLWSGLKLVVPKNKRK
jgi:hypothetical protein